MRLFRNSSRRLRSLWLSSSSTICWANKWQAPKVSLLSKPLPSFNSRSFPKTILLIKRTGILCKLWCQSTLNSLPNFRTLKAPRLLRSHLPLNPLANLMTFRVPRLTKAHLNRALSRQMQAKIKKSCKWVAPNSRLSSASTAQRSWKTSSRESSLESD